MRFFLADPNLYDAGGHNMDYAAEVAQAMTDRGAEVVVLSNRRFLASDRQLHVMPTFSMGLREGYPAIIRASASLDQRWHRMMAKINPRRIQKPFEPLHFRAKVLISNLNRWLMASPIRPDDHWFFPTITWSDALHIGLWFKALSTRPARADLVLRFDPPQAVDQKAAMRRALEGIEGVFLWVDTPELADAYGSFLRKPINLIRMPFPRIVAATPSSATPYAIYLGESRRDKGFHHLPDFARHIEMSSTGANLFVQILGNSCKDSVVYRAKSALLASNSRQLHLIHGGLSTADYNRYLENAAAVICLYDSDAYKLRSAGIITQAVSAGIPVIMTPKPCAPLAMIERNNCEDLVFFYGYINR